MTNTIFDIKVNSDGTVNITSDYKNVKLDKVTSLQHFLSTFGSSFSSFETPVLPINCRKIIKSSNSELYIFEYPAMYRTIKYGSRVYENVFCPRTIFIVKIAINGSNKQLVKSHAYIVDPITPFSVNMPLYSWCFNNYNEGYGSASICWGSGGGTLQNIINGDSSGYGSLFNLYMSLGFNDHLQANVYMNAMQVNDSDLPNGRLDQMERICVFLQKNKIFPLDAVSKKDTSLASIIIDFNEGKF